MTCRHKHAVFPIISATLFINVIYFIGPDFQNNPKQILAIETTTADPLQENQLLECNEIILIIIAIWLTSKLSLFRLCRLLFLFVTNHLKMSNQIDSNISDSFNSNDKASLILFYHNCCLTTNIFFFHCHHYTLLLHLL